MKGRKLLALLLAAMMIFGLAACGNTETPAANNTAAPAQTEAAAQAPAQTTAPAGGAEAPAQTEAAAPAAPAEAEDEEGPNEYGYNVTWDDTAEVIVMYPSMGPVPQGQKAVEDEMNKIAEEEIDVHVTLKSTEVGSYDQQINLMISSGEKLDLMVTFPAGPASLGVMAAQHQLMDITDLLPQYAPKAVADLGDLILGTQVNSRTYAITTNKGFASSEKIWMRKDVLEELDMVEKAQNIKTWSEYIEILEAYKEIARPGMSPIIPSDGHGCILADFKMFGYLDDDFTSTVALDNLGDTLNLVSCIGDDPTVLNTYRTEAFRKNWELARSMYEKGLVYGDAVTNTEMYTPLMQSGVGFSFTNVNEDGTEAIVDVNCQTPMVYSIIVEKPITTSSLTKFTWAVPVTATEPEAALTFLEMMYNDPRIANLFAWGIEGIDYELDANGVAQFIDGNQNPPYHTVAFLNPNSFILYPFGDDAPTLREDQKRFLEEAPVSPFLGFAADTSAVTDEISALSNVIEQYSPAIVSGTADEAMFNEFLEKLDGAGIDKVVALYQEQLNAWLATK